MAVPGGRAGGHRRRPDPGCEDDRRRQLAGTQVATGACGMTLELDDPQASAEEAGLRYVTDATPGIRRRRAGKGWPYVGPDGTPDRGRRPRRMDQPAGHPAGVDRRLDLSRSGAATSRRPAVMPAAGSSIATTRAGARFATRRSTAGSSSSHGPCRASGGGPSATSDGAGLPREKVLALVVRLLEETLIRVGNEEYARDNRSLRPVDPARPPRRRCAGETIRFTFRGKCGKDHEIELRDRRLARLVKQCQELPGPGAVPVPRRRRAPRRRDLGRRQRLPARDQRRRVHAPRTSGPGPARSLRRWRSRSSPRSTTTRGARRPWSGPSRTWRSSSGTRRRCAAPATSTPRSSSATSTGRWSRRCQRRARGVGRGAHALRAEEAAVLGLLQARLARERRSRRRAA